MSKSAAESDDEVLYPYDAEAPLLSADTFYYPMNFITNSISAAIQGGNFERAIELINSGRELNLADNRGFTALHVAVQSGNLEVLDALLRQPLIRRDVRSHRGETPLFISLAERGNDAVIIKLIESGCDVTIPNLEDVTPLSLAVRRSGTHIANLLVQKGADVDAQDFDGYTPLHHAVSENCYEAVCMLLYYNASVNETSLNGKVTPFSLALNSSDGSLAKVLFDYVTDFNAANQNGHSPLYLALRCKSPLIKDILLKCDVNKIKHCFSCLKKAIVRRESSIFRYMFPRTNHRKLAYKTTLLEYFIFYCNFNPAEFIECLHLILGSEYASIFVDKCPSIRFLIRKFCREKISQKDRVDTLYLLYTWGLCISYIDFYWIYEYFGFNEELETIFIAQPIVENYTFYPNVVSHDIVVWNLFSNYCGKMSTDELHAYKIVKETRNFQACLMDYLKFFTHDFRTSYKSLQLLHNHSEKFELEQVMNVRHIASLQELCRNEIRFVMISRAGAKDMYKLYDAIKALPVPKVIQDILHLKRPLYNNTDQYCLANFLSL